MKAFEFSAQVTSQETLQIPPEVASQLREGQPVRVLLLVGEAEEDADWARLTAEQFLRGYDDGDAIYDNLPGR
jgi:hypothetical protein